MSDGSVRHESEAQQEMPFKCQVGGCPNIVEHLDHAVFQVDGDWHCATCARDEIGGRWDEKLGEFDEMLAQIKENQSLGVKFVPGEGTVRSIIVWNPDESDYQICRRMGGHEDYYWSGEWTTETRALESLAGAHPKSTAYDGPTVVKLDSQRDSDELKEAAKLA